MKQLQLWDGRSIAPAHPVASAASFEEWLGAELGRPVRLLVTNNRSTMLSVRERSGTLDVRLHRFFLAAAAAEREALARYLATSDPAAARVLDAFIGQESAKLPPPPRRVRPHGRFHDLTAIRDELNATFFHGACSARITWGHAGGRRNRRTIQLGCYVGRERLIRIHPCLDQEFVPRQYVAWVVFHEMLHELFGVDGHGQRRTLHPPEFGALEATFPGYRECKQWERENLPRLLRFRRPSAGRRRVSPRA